MAAENLVPTLFAVPLVGLLLFRRYQRVFGRQSFAPARMVVRMALLAVLAGLMLTSTRGALGYASLAVGALAGAGLAVVALRTTTFEANEDGRFYTPNLWTGILVTALFLGRLVGRFVTFYMAPPPPIAGVPASPFDGMERSPLTLAIVALTAAYSMLYFGGVLRAMRRLAPAAVPAGDGEDDDASDDAETTDDDADEAPPRDRHN